MYEVLFLHNSNQCFIYVKKLINALLSGGLTLWE